MKIIILVENGRNYWKSSKWLKNVSFQWFLTVSTIFRKVLTVSEKWLFSIILDFLKIFNGLITKGSLKCICVCNYLSLFSKFEILKIKIMKICVENLEIGLTLNTCLTIHKGYIYMFHKLRTPPLTVHNCKNCTIWWLHQCIWW